MDDYAARDGKSGSDEFRGRPRDPRREREARRLLERYHRDGDQRAREQVIERFLPLARSLAARYTRAREPFDDLLQVASVGLVKAVDRFDLEREHTFATYAVPTILGELRRHFRDTGWAIHLPRALQERTLEVDRAAQDLSKRLGRSPTAADIAGATNLTIEEVAEAMNARYVASETTSLDQPIGPDDGTVADLLGEEDERFDVIHHTATIAPILRALPEREREILRLRFAEDLTQAEIATRIGISQMQVSRLLRRSLARLSAVNEQPVRGLASGAG
ncbi:MAG: polymerase, sigma 28 subunit, Sig subfamily [Solirubrobacterales bacterium]|nr:polymerase, sigma 28 subunit, Sig subfamily [Solirubrobacterales bacterium]